MKASINTVELQLGRRLGMWTMFTGWFNEGPIKSSAVSYIPSGAMLLYFQKANGFALRPCKLFNKRHIHCIFNLAQHGYNNGS